MAKEVRTHRSIRSELTRTENALFAARLLPSDPWRDGYLKGAQQALAWAIRDNASAPNQRPRRPTSKRKGAK